MTVLVGTQITCNETADDQDWKQVLELLQKLGPDHIMGVAIGNELELLWQKSYASKECIDNMWDGGYFWEKTVSRIGDLDNLGSDYSKLPVTSVFGGAILGAEPFINTHQARVTNLSQERNKSVWLTMGIQLERLPISRPQRSLGSSQCAQV